MTIIAQERILVVIFVILAALMVLISVPSYILKDIQENNSELKSFRMSSFKSYSIEIFEIHKKIIKNTYFKNINNLIKSLTMFKKWGFLFAPDSPR